MKKLILLAFILSSTLLVVVAFSTKVDALSGSQFSAGNIIDDSVFYNKFTMGTSDIQKFMESKVPTCDTNGSESISYRFNASPLRVGEPGDPYVTTSRAEYGHRYQLYWQNLPPGERNPVPPGSEAPFTCIRTYTQTVPQVTSSQNSYCPGNITSGVKSAAQIVYDVSQACEINPQVLLVLLQKEQSLLTDTWPWGRQYTSATGYGCPDTAPCDSEYYGFFNQVFQAAKGYKRYQANPGNYAYRTGTTTAILYNPNRSCGSSNVFLQNQATTGLYIYTPYQPNTAALNNLYGSGDGCSAYGNRNFWRMFNDWFGPSVGPLVRTIQSDELYYTDGAYKHRVTSMELAAQYGLGLSDVRYVTQSYIDNLVTPTVAGLQVLVKSDSDSDEDAGNLYLLSNGKRYTVQSMTQFNNFGFNTNAISLLPYSQLLRMPLGGSLSNFIKGGDGFVYTGADQSKRGIIQGDLYNSLNPSGKITTLSDFVLNKIKTGPLKVNGAVTISDTSGRIWIINNNGWHYAASMDVVNCLSIDTSSIPRLSPKQTSVGTLLESARCTLVDSSNNYYLLDKGRAYHALDSWGLDSIAINLGDRFIEKATKLTPSLVVQSPNGSLYTIEGGKKRYITAMTGLKELGINEDNLTRLTSSGPNTIPNGLPRYPSRTIFQDSSNGQLFVMDNDKMRYIPSMYIFGQYGFNERYIKKTSATFISKFPSKSALKLIVGIDNSSGGLVADRATSHLVSSTDLPNYGINSSETISTYLQPTPSKTATKYIKSESSAMLYVMDAGQKRPVYSWARFTSLGGNTDNITVYSDALIKSIPTGDPA